MTVIYLVSTLSLGSLQDQILGRIERSNRPLSMEVLSACFGSTNPMIVSLICQNLAYLGRLVIFIGESGKVFVSTPSKFPGGRVQAVATAKVILDDLSFDLVSPGQRIRAN